MTVHLKVREYFKLKGWFSNVNPNTCLMYDDKQIMINQSFFTRDFTKAMLDEDRELKMHTRPYKDNIQEFSNGSDLFKFIYEDDWTTQTEFNLIGILIREFPELQSNREINFYKTGREVFIKYILEYGTLITSDKKYYYPDQGKDKGKDINKFIRLSLLKNRSGSYSGKSNFYSGQQIVFAQPTLGDIQSAPRYFRRDIKVPKICLITQYLESSQEDIKSRTETFINKFIYKT